MLDILDKIDLIFEELEIVNELRLKRVRHIRSGDMRKKRRKAKIMRRRNRAKLKIAARKRKRLTRKASYKRKAERFGKRGRTPTGKRIRTFMNRL